MCSERGHRVDKLGPFELGKVHRADCLDALPTVPDGSLDAILTDPPYGSTHNEWDNPVDWHAFFLSAWRVLRPSAPVIALVDDDTWFEMRCADRVMAPRYRYSMVWRHNLPTGHLNAKVRPMLAHLLLVVFCRETPPWYPQMVVGQDTHGRRAKHAAVAGNSYGRHEHTRTDTTLGKWPITVLSFDAIHPSIREHPSEKPIKLAEWMIRSFTDPGSVVCDPFTGGGWMGMAAYRTGRRFVGFDSDPASVDLANRRIAAEHERLGEVRPETAASGQQIGLLTETKG